MEEEATQAAAIEHHEMRPFSGTEAHGSFMSSISSISCTISYTKSAKIYLFIFIIVTCIPLVFGGAFTIIFMTEKEHNINGAVVSFFMAIISCGTLSIFVMHLFGKVEKYHDLNTLNGLKVLGMIVSVSAGVALGVYTILAFLRKQAFALKGANYFSAAVFSGLCLATSIELYIVAQWYQNALQKNKIITTHVVPRMPSAN